MRLNRMRAGGLKCACLNELSCRTSMSDIVPITVWYINLQFFIFMMKNISPYWHLCGMWTVMLLIISNSVMAALHGASDSMATSTTWILLHIFVILQWNINICVNHLPPSYMYFVVDNWETVLIIAIYKTIAGMNLKIKIKIKEHLLTKDQLISNIKH